MLQRSISATATMSGTKQTHRPPTHSATRRILSPQIAPPLPKAASFNCSSQFATTIAECPSVTPNQCPVPRMDEFTPLHTPPVTSHQGLQTGHAFRTFSKNGSRSQFSPEIPLVVIAVTVRWFGQETEHNGGQGNLLFEDRQALMISDFGVSRCLPTERHQNGPRQIISNVKQHGDVKR